jgi:hypothetical protein
VVLVLKERERKREEVFLNFSLPHNTNTAALLP